MVGYSVWGSCRGQSEFIFKQFIIPILPRKIKSSVSQLIWAWNLQGIRDTDFWEKSFFQLKKSAWSSRWLWPSTGFTWMRSSSPWDTEFFFLRTTLPSSMFPVFFFGWMLHGSTESSMFPESFFFFKSKDVAYRNQLPRINSRTFRKQSQACWRTEPKPFKNWWIEKILWKSWNTACKNTWRCLSQARSNWMRTPPSAFTTSHFSSSVTSVRSSLSNCGAWKVALRALCSTSSPKTLTLQTERHVHWMTTQAEQHKELQKSHIKFDLPFRFRFAEVDTAS